MSGSVMSKKKKAPVSKRSVSRLAAVQALYQMELAGTDLATIITEFAEFRLGKVVDEEQFRKADRAFFEKLVRGVIENQLELDPEIKAFLSESWRLSRLDSTLRAILRVGALELLKRKDVPARVVISEYIDISHAFFEGDEPKVVNGVLDKLARQYRADEFSR